MKKSVILIFIFFIFFSVFQNGYAQQNRIKAGYKITIKLDNYKENLLFLVAYYGGEPYILDTAFSHKGVYTFAKKRVVLQSGIYSIQTASNQNVFDLIVDQSRYFEIETAFENPLHYKSIKKSEENIHFFEYQKGEVTQQDLTPYLETSPNSLLSKYVKAKHFSITKTFQKDTSLTHLNLSTKEKNQYLLTHFFDPIDLKDKRLFRTPLKINIRYYFSELLSEEVLEEKELFNIVNQFLERTIDTNIRPIDLEIHFFYVKKLMQLYMSNIPQFDSLFVYLHDHYFIPEQDQWGIFDASFNRVFSMVAERKRRTMPGRFIEPLIAYDSAKHAVSTEDVHSDYTIIWFWDPDCDHCITETPVLHDFYKQKHRSLNFEVIAVSVTEDYERWIKFIQENQLEWINLSYAMGEPNYDFLDFFDLMTTPGIFLIDKDHKIIARQVSLDKIQNILESKTTTVQ
jgi:thiol-disulfide isomerase/thioredoxin